MLILMWEIFKLKIRPLKWQTYTVNCTENAGAIYISQEHFKYKVAYEMPADSNLLYFFLSFDMYFNGKRVE